MLEEPKSPPGELTFARSIPLEKARRDVLLAYKMNGDDLPPEHGFPVRAIVPGWYAMASVKWLQRIIVTDRPFTGYYQTLDYAYWEKRDGIAELKPLTEIQVKAEIARPAEDEIVPAKSSVCVRGGAWACDAEITKVELSTDGGATWSDAKLLGESKLNAWRFWEFDWQTPPQPGKQTLIARATDSLGRTQPVMRDPRSRHLHDQSSAADRSRSEVANASRLRNFCRRSYQAHATFVELQSCFALSLGNVTRF